MWIWVTEECSEKWKKGEKEVYVNVVTKFMYKKFSILAHQELQLLMFFRFFQLVVSHPAFSKDEDLQKVLKEENVSFSNNKILLQIFGHDPCECG